MDSSGDGTATSKGPLSQKTLPKQGFLYFDHLYSEYLSLLESDPAGTLSTEAKESIGRLLERRKHGSLTWNDLYTFDLLLSQYQPLAKLSRKVWNLRSRYRDVAGIREYESYLASKPPDWAQPGGLNDKEAELRADIQYLLGEIYLRYAITPIREEVRDRIVRRVAGASLIWLAITITFAFLVHGEDPNSHTLPRAATLIIVMFVGSMGGIVSMQQRYQSLPDEGDTIQSVAELMHGWYTLFLPAISGAMFATVLYLLILAGMLQGGLFPSMVEDPQYPQSAKTAFLQTQPEAAQEAKTIQEAKQQKKKGTTQDGVSFYYFLREADPRSRTDYAKLLVWAFIAGFAERFVPDALSRFTERKEAGAGIKP